MTGREEKKGMKDPGLSLSPVYTSILRLLDVDSGISLS
jgi:hypothetical protein